ncbi:hypothetical protein PQI07_26795 [Methylobacterium sp. 092160098-2]|nr:hypothetical protein [Methylobacterium sp. 092160098-2]MDE4914283.1 hypothetical protein [Methylobacterium sp. 092160098-2]
MPKDGQRSIQRSNVVPDLGQPITDALGLAEELAALPDQSGNGVIGG